MLACPDVNIRTVASCMSDASCQKIVLVFKFSNFKTFSFKKFIIICISTKLSCMYSYHFFKFTPSSCMIYNLFRVKVSEICHNNFVIIFKIEKRTYNRNPMVSVFFLNCFIHSFYHLVYLK